MLASSYILRRFINWARPLPVDQGLAGHHRAAPGMMLCYRSLGVVGRRLLHAGCLDFRCAAHGPVLSAAGDQGPCNIRAHR